MSAKQSKISVHVLADVEKYGRVVGLLTDRGFLEIRVTPSGLIRAGEAQVGVPGWAPNTPIARKGPVRPCTASEGLDGQEDL
jgi:hypothetical protein